MRLSIGSQLLLTSLYMQIWTFWGHLHLALCPPIWNDDVEDYGASYANPGHFSWKETQIKKIACVEALTCICGFFWILTSASVWKKILMILVILKKIIPIAVLIKYQSRMGTHVTLDSSRKKSCKLQVFFPFWFCCQHLISS